MLQFHLASSNDWWGSFIYISVCTHIHTLYIHYMYCIIYIIYIKCSHVTRVFLEGGNRFFFLSQTGWERKRENKITRGMLTITKFSVLFIYYCMCSYVHNMYIYMPENMCRGQRRTFGSQFSPIFLRQALLASAKLCVPRSWSASSGWIHSFCCLCLPPHEPWDYRCTPQHLIVLGQNSGSRLDSTLS